MRRSSPYTIRLLLLAGAVAVSALAGCITEERIPGNPGVVARSAFEEEDYEDLTEEHLLEVIDEDPDNARAWWALGDYCEREGRYFDALTAYIEMQGRIEKAEAKSGMTYTSGLYLVGKMHARLKNYPEAVRCMEAILEHQPEDITQAALHKDFREAHYLLGAIYFVHHQYEIAEKHLLTYRELDPASTRADTMLMKIDRKLRWEGRPVQSSYRPGPEAAAADPAATATPAPPAGAVEPAPPSGGR